ncbi:MAG TPA: serine/threonine-protein kinase [bacterium]|nr:serine/threonine-protein kinase [bacterium]
MPRTPILPPTAYLPPGPFTLGPASSGQRYQGVSLIAEGGMGAVYSGHSRAAGNPPVAIKLALGALRNPRELARFQREIAAVAGLDHPNIVRTLDHGQDARWGPFIVMELLKGETLEEFLDRRPYGRVSLEEAARIALPVCGALLYAHTREIPLIHRDIKPANVFLADVVKVMDFGLGRSPDAIPEGAGARQKLTEAGMVLGTLQYIAPEQCQGRPGLASDVYALGILLYQMIEGRFPFPKHIQQPLDLIKWHGKGVPEPMTECPSPAVRELVGGMMEKDPKKRPDLDEVQNRLSEVVAPKPRVSRNEFTPTLVGIPILPPVASEMLTARCPLPGAAVPEAVSAAEALTTRAAAASPTLEVAVPQEADDREYRPSSRAVAGELRMRRQPGEGLEAAGSDKIFVQLMPSERRPSRTSFLHFLGWIPWLYRKLFRRI